MNVLIPGGGGYVGSVLKSWLLVAGHKVTVYDTFWFGRSVPDDNANLKVIDGDVRDAKQFRAACQGQDAVIYLASISNNDFCVQQPQLAHSVNVEAMFYVPRIAKDCGVKRFVYASSVAGYAVEHAKESDGITSATPYALGKLCGEGATREQDNYVIVRSASVCGPSSRMRFDITVNRMVHDACKRGVITVNGGEQKRSHVHIYDLCDFYVRLLDVAAERVIGETFNVVAENQRVIDTAEIVAEETGARIEVQPRSDTRSYTVDGTKARQILDFRPKRTVRKAVIDMKARLDSDAKGITHQWTDSLTNKNYMNFADGIA